MMRTLLSDRNIFSILENMQVYEFLFFYRIFYGEGLIRRQHKYVYLSGPFGDKQNNFVFLIYLCRGDIRKFTIVMIYKLVYD